jgi:AcrR family transcriptional regulator
MARTYVKSKRAEREASTRQRIAEAALALHTEHGPANTTISMIAERAGVQRHTVYAHFADERSILMACSGLHEERNPLPDPMTWEADNDPEVKLRKALSALYGWYAQNRALIAHVIRDLEVHEPTREVAAVRTAPALAAIANTLSGGLDATGRAALHLAMSFHTWRALVAEGSLKTEVAVELMVRTVLRTAARAM